MEIANPIYDAAFKYLMQDDRAAPPARRAHRRTRRRVAGTAPAGDGRPPRRAGRRRGGGPAPRPLPHGLRRPRAHRRRRPAAGADRDPEDQRPHRGRALPRLPRPAAVQPRQRGHASVGAARGGARRHHLPAGLRPGDFRRGGARRAPAGDGAAHGGRDRRRPPVHRGHPPPQPRRADPAAAGPAAGRPGAGCCRSSTRGRRASSGAGRSC